MCDINVEKFNDLNLDSILNYVSKTSGITIEAMQSKIQTRKIVEARQAYFILSKQMIGTSLRIIGEKVGNKDHATVIWGIKQAHIPAVNEIVTKVKEKFYANL